MITGTLGSVVFKMSSKQAKTIKSLSWKKSYGYSEHKRYGKNSLLEYTGRAPDDLEFEMEISAFLGVRPLKMLNDLAAIAKKHQVVTFVLGTDVIGTKWVITNIENTTERFFMDGTLVSAKLKVKIKEYGEE